VRHGYKKKGERNKVRKQQSTAADDFFREVGFSVGREGPEMNLKTIERLGLYVRSDMKKCLKQEKIVKLVVPDLAENHTVHKKWVWEYHMNELMKTERILETTLCNLFSILMSLCDSALTLWDYKLISRNWSTPEVPTTKKSNTTRQWPI